MRRFGRPPARSRTYTDRAGAYAVIARGSQLLITEQVTPLTGIGVEVQLPGGGIDPGEGPIQALHREALEETGYRLAIIAKLGVYQRFTYMPEYDLWARKLCHIYLCRPGPRIGPPTEPGHSARWMEAARATDALVSPGDAAFARRALGLYSVSTFC